MSKIFHDTTIANVSSHDSLGAKGNFALIDFDLDCSPHIQWSDTYQLIDTNSIRHLHGIGDKKALQFKRVRIKTIQDFAKIKNLKKLSQKMKFSQYFLEKMQLKARSVIENKVFQISEFILPQIDLIFSDIETDLACKKVWLIGILHNGNFTQFFAKNWKEEKSMLMNFLTFLEKKHNFTLVSFSGTGFDRNVVHRALVRQNLDSDFFFSLPHIDLCQLIRRSFIFPNQSYALKNLGAYLEYPFEHPDLSGLGVALEYHNHLKEKRNLDSRVLEYNKDDVSILPYIIEKIKSKNLDN